ncbi:MAG: asparaginase [Gemmatimonadales bacterium]|nr:asparaginase [Gemmatimonadales bacterium]
MRGTGAWGTGRCGLVRGVAPKVGRGPMTAKRDGCLAEARPLASPCAVRSRPSGPEPSAPGPVQLLHRRGPHVESVQRVHVAVVDAGGRLLAAAGEPDFRTFWRSAAKPLQALPVVHGGAADRFGFGAEALALACASHSSEPRHVAVARRMLAAVGAEEAALACGPHVPLSPRIAAEVAREGTTLTPSWSNCSGKHAAMLAACAHHGWAPAGYERSGHPLQARIRDAVRRWTDVPDDTLGEGVDGCTTVSFHLPLTGMALAYARLTAPADALPAACRDEAAPAARLVQAMMADPFLVAGTGRACTDLMAAFGGALVAKVGAAGVYSAGLVGHGIGIALKIEDGGDLAETAVALVAVLDAVVPRLAPSLAEPLAAPAVRAHARLPVRSTRGADVGSVDAAGALAWS